MPSPLSDFATSLGNLVGRSTRLSGFFIKLYFSFPILVEKNINDVNVDGDDDDDDDNDSVNETNCHRRIK